ncbi:NADH dehydrogenase [Anaerosporomusa subterranea]|uniref:NADH dehydrogenase n=1 Tax=Anaerosporomusa subterranea TaxID=1794912 RepID=A0A154BN67_ANASB|nr:NADH-quinone oxidoreductase subunit C [Anaerosporomusa subterranea]KYZ75351.1 NADH dehydrogenase [Anaerosporomusa subterranea]
MSLVSVQNISAAGLRAAANVIYRGGKSQLIAMFANDERELDNCFAIYCLFAEREAPKTPFRLLRAVVPASGPLEFPSLTPLTAAAAWYEREIHDLFGLTPLEHPDLRRLVLHENWPEGLYPLRRDFNQSHIDTADESYPIPCVAGEGVFEVPVGPIHAGIIEPGHFRFSQAGESVINLEAKLFFTHRGIEKSVEGMPIERAILSVERICGACSVSHAISFSQAVESLAEIKISYRAQLIRVIAAELERLYNHIGDVGNLCAGLGFAVGTSHGARLKEKLMRINETISGNRFLRGWVVPGGVTLNLPAAMAIDLVVELAAIETDFAELMALLRENEAFLNRVETTGILPHQAALDLGVVGVAARASGVAEDLRHDHPYACYNELDFRTPVYKDGDVAARLWVRADEVVVSIAIIRQAVARLADAPPALCLKLPPITAYKQAFGWSESARGANIHWLMTGKDNTVYRCFVRSASYSNWPSLTVAVPGDIIPDFPLINKSFELCYACLDR